MTLTSLWLMPLVGGALVAFLPPRLAKWFGALVAAAALVVAAGFGLALVLYGRGVLRGEPIGQPGTWLYALLLNAYYVDWLYDRAIVHPLYRVSIFAARVVDARIIDGVVNLAGRAVVLGAAGLRRLQTGYIVNYALTMLAGAVIVVGFLLAR